MTSTIIHKEDVQKPKKHIKRCLLPRETYKLTVKAGKYVEALDSHTFSIEVQNGTYRVLGRGLAVSYTTERLPPL